MNDLDKLIAAVEAGRKPSFPEIARGVGGDNAQDVEMAFEGKLDAAKRLHDALLPGWDYRVGREGNDGHAIVFVAGRLNEYADDWQLCPNNPARAWLLSILKALKAKGDA